MKSFLRQDPEVVMVGEIRDQETVEIAIKAALTGHLVFSTLHTNDAISTIVRLTNMGVPNFMVASAFSLIVAQRLARRNCKSPMNSDQKRMWDISGNHKDEITTFLGCTWASCEKCSDTGYKGRQGIYEILVVSKPH